MPLHGSAVQELETGKSGNDVSDRKNTILREDLVYRVPIKFRGAARRGLEACADRLTRNRNLESEQDALTFKST